MQELPPQLADDWPEGSMTTRIERLDNARQAFFDRAKLFARLPSQTNRHEMLAASLRVVDSFAHSAQGIFELDEAREVKAGLIVGVLKQEDEAIVGFFNKTAGREISVPHAPEHLETVVDYCLEEEPDKALPHTLNYFGAGMTYDINQFLHYVEAAREKRVQSLFSLGKLAAGAALGAYLIRRLKKA